MGVIEQMRIYHDENPEDGDGETIAVNEWLSRVVVVDGVAGFIACPDCMADERISDEELLDPSFDGDHAWAAENGHPANCILCKDTGKLWVSI